MTHEDKGHFAKKHPPGRKARPEIAEAVKKRASNGEITCPAAHGIATNFNIPPEEVGFTADFFEISLAKCQMGLFGYRPEKSIVKPAETVSQAMEEAIRDFLMNGRLTCKNAWEIAETFGIKKMEVSSACETLKIKIISCQLGAF